MNNVILIGRLTADPTLRHVSGSGMTVADFRLAVDKNLARDKKAQFESMGKPTADFIRIVVWGRLAETCSTYLKKGSKVAITGSISTSTYTKDGEKRYSTDVIARNVEFLERVEARYDSGNSGLIDDMANDMDDSFPEIDDPDHMPF